MITIEEFMTAKPYVLRETDSIDDARAIMTEKHIRHIPVTDSNNHVLGLITQRDVLAATDPTSLQSDNKTSQQKETECNLSEIMIKNVRVIHKSDSLRQAAMYMQSHKYGCLPVVYDDCLVGIITDSDFVTIAINLLEQVELSEEETGEENLLDEIV